jgi:hypothetical protein
MSNFAKEPARSIGYKAANTTINTAYQAGQYSQVVNIRVANVLGSDADVSIYWYDSATAIQYTLVDASTVPAHRYANYPFDAFALKRDDEIRIKNSTSSAFHSVLTVVEVPGRSG